MDLYSVDWGNKLCQLQRWGGLKTNPIASHSVAVEALQEYPKTQIGFWEQEDLL